MTKKKKILAATLSLVLVAVIAVGSTLAYFFTKTDPITNVFTVADNVKANLEEPSWNPDKAIDLVAGKKIAKDPQITNTSNHKIDEYAAIKLTFQKGDGTIIDDREKRDIHGKADITGMTDMERLMSLITIDRSSNWTLAQGTQIDSQQVYTFNKILKQGEKSDPLFYSVTINKEVTSEQLLWLAGNFAHNDDCYEYEAHDDAKCTVTYFHHESCAIKNEAGNEKIAQGGTLNGKTCDCIPQAIHQAGCPSLVAHIKKDCGHTELVSGLGNFNIKVEGAVLQADVFKNVADATADLVGLFAKK